MADLTLDKVILQEMLAKALKPARERALVREVLEAASHRGAPSVWAGHVESGVMVLPPIIGDDIVLQRRLRALTQARPRLVPPAARDAATRRLADQAGPSALS